MTFPFLIIAAVTVGAAIAAMALRDLVHCALSLVVTFAGLAALYLQLNAEFVGLVQILVYVGAVTILIVFAILLTRGTDPAPPASIGTSTPWAVSIAVAAFVVMAGAVVKSGAVVREGMSLKGAALPASVQPVAGAAVAASAPGVSVKGLGQKLMAEHVVPLEVLGLLLTASMIGAVIVAMPERTAAQSPGRGTGNRSEGEARAEREGGR